jgi:phosphopantetheine--protein transferase-like protein
MMAAVASMADPGHRYAGAENVLYKAPVKLHGTSATELIVSATPVQGGVACTLSSSRKGRTGRLIETEHFSSMIRWSMAEPASLPPMGMPDHPVSAEEIYSRFFHGPIFQVLTQGTATTFDGMLVEGKVAHLAIAGGLQTIPLVLEAAFQAAGLHGMMVNGVMALPQEIREVVVHGSVRDDEPIRLTVRRDGEVYDVDVHGEGGRILSLRGFKMVEAGPLPPEHLFDPPKGGWTAAVIARIKSGKQEGEKALLTEADRAYVTSRGTPKRKADRILGRMAAKQAVSDLTGLEPADFRIENRSSGEPFVVTESGEPVPHVSISHRDGQAVAVATRMGRAGIDLEVVEARAPSFAETWFRLSEQKMCNGNPRVESQVWAIKEAVLKALGTGLKLDPREVEVLEVANGRANVRLWGEASQRHAALGGGELGVDVEDEQTLVIAVAWLAS